MELYYAQGERIMITKKLHLHDPLKKRDTICGKIYPFPDISTEPIEFKDGKYYSNGFEIDTMCEKCVEIHNKILTNTNH